MSRSYKKTPIFKEKAPTRKHATRKARRKINSGKFDDILTNAFNLDKRLDTDIEAKDYYSKDKVYSKLRQTKGIVNSTGTSKKKVSAYTVSQVDGKHVVSKHSYTYDLLGNYKYPKFRNKELRAWYRDFYHK